MGNYALAVELARAQRLVKGYGETHQDMKIGDCGLAVPLKRYDGRYVGALQITGTLDDPPQKHIELLQTAANELRPQLI